MGIYSPLTGSADAITPPATWTRPTMKGVSGRDLDKGEVSLLTRVARPESVVQRSRAENPCKNNKVVGYLHLGLALARHYPWLEVDPA